MAARKPLLALILCLPAAWASPLYGCFAVIVGREASADGSVLLGHNEQNSGRRILNFRRVPRRQFPPEAKVQLHRGGELDQVEQTWASLWSENPGLEFGDAYLNQWGVAVLSDACPTREDEYQTLLARGQIRHGGIGHMLRRLIAERARTAREGVRLAGGLIERFGYVASGRTYLIADPREAWLLAVLRGRRWVAQRVPDDAVVLLPNVHIIGQVDLEAGGRFLASPDVIDYAAGRGWFDPGGGEPFSFRKAYNKNRNDPPDLRRWWGRQLISGQRVPWPPPHPPPLGVKPRQKMTVAAVAAILRDTSGPGRKLSTARTQECAIFQLRTGMPGGIGCVYWRTTAEPAVSVLTPWYAGILETPKDYYRAVDIETQLSLDHHFNPPPATFDPDPKLAWWAFKTLQDLVREDYERRIQLVRPVWMAFEERAFRDQPELEKEALRLWQTDREAARVQLTEYCTKLANEARREAKSLCSLLRAGAKCASE